MIQTVVKQLNRLRSRSGSTIVLFAIALALCSVPTTANAQEQAWEYSPYNVQIWLATEASAELDDQVRESLTSALSQQIESLIGAPWSAEVVEPPGDIASTMLVDDQLLTTEILVEAAPEALASDKIILLTIRVNPREFHIYAKEFDCRTRLFGAPVQRVIRQPNMLGKVCFDAVAKAFRAITRLEVGAPKSAKVRVRAGGLVMHDSSPCYVGIDDVLHPIQRNNDREGEPTRIVPIEWTFLQVQTPGEVNPYLMDCRVWSGKPNPVTGRITKRKERYALKVKPVTETTTLKVLSRVVVRGTEAYPMPGLEVYAKAPQPDPPKEPEPAPVEEPKATEDEATEDEASTDAATTEEDPATDTGSENETTEAVAEKKPTPPKKSEGPKVQGDPAKLLGKTDWNGTLEIVQSDTPLRILYLKNGAQLLARLPMVPGLETELIASVPDDAPRLQAEGFVKGLQGQLMDLEAQREILKARFMLRIEDVASLKGDEREAKLKEAQTLLEEIKQLPTRNDLVRQLDIQQNQQVESPIKSVQARIDQLYAKMREALGKYLSPSMVNELTRVLNDSRRSATASATSNRVE